ncbi:MAG: UvrD-helicase domain-containing protein [Nitrospira sp.]|nr:UvrD-helicase domain-containing protein [bacterium]MBL7050330.1 UvrD-helicase domain-containing protein [Nitrospira sp.]
MKDIYETLSQLNPRQKEAVMHTEGPLLILAGAGSGKTRVITMRTAYLMHNGAAPESILAVTFTNKAAKEMRERVKSMVNKGATMPTISTFHSLCLRILRKEIEHLGYRTDFTIYDTSDQLSLMRNIMSDVRFYDKDFKPESILERISRTKNEFTVSMPSAEDVAVEEVTEILYPRYLELLKSMNAVDFDDLLILALKLLKEHPEVLKRYRERYRYIMVDEYQDTNSVQYKFISLLAGKQGNLCVVGDDDQSIYGWRGADLSNILGFEKDFPNTFTVRLEQNYRSFGNILLAANGVIKNNRKRMPKSLWTDKGDGPMVNIFKASNTEDEADWVAERISMIKVDKNIQYEDFAIIYRANIFSRPFEEALRMQRIPYTVVGGTSYFERKEIKDITAYLKIMANPADDLSLLRAVAAPKRGLGPSSINILTAYGRERSLGLCDAFAHAEEIPGLSKKAADSAYSVFDIVLRYREKFKDSSRMAETLKEMIEEINYRDYITSLYKTPEAAYRRIENIDGFIDSLAHYVSKGKKPTLQGFLESMALTDMLDKQEETQGNGVTLISFHSAKGLEFPVVFIVGAEEDILPHKKSVNTPGGVEEERRLFYVGMTRAMKELFVTHTNHRRKYGKETPSVASRFLEEIPGNASRHVDRYEKMEPEQEKAYVKSMFDDIMAKLQS